MEYSNTSFVDAGEPVGDPDSAREMEISPERLELLGKSLAEKRDDWVSARVSTGIERRWLEDHDQFMGKDEATKMVASMMDSAEQGYPVMNRGARPQRSTVFINITRPKTNTAEARVANMLLPTDDRNFGLKPSPSPDLTAAAKLLQKIKLAQQKEQQPPMPQQAGQPPNTAQTAQPQGGLAQPQDDPEAILDAANDASKAMQTEIDDQFAECNWNGECRAMLHDAAVYGTGILKGPIVTNKATKSWTPIDHNGTQVHVLEVGSEIKPVSYKVSPWNVIPDPSCGNDIHNGSGIYEFYDYTSKQLRELVKQPGFLEDKISQVLSQGPDPSQNKTALEKRNNNKKETYKVWEYWGEFDPEDMRAANVDVDEGHTGLISGCVIFVNEIVIKGFLNPLDTGEIPYDFYPWEEDEESPWGYGVPFLCRPAQRVLTAAWRQLMDNSGNTVGPQTIIKPSVISPADGNWQVTGNKLWNCNDESVDVRTAFACIDIPNKAKDLENIIMLAKQFADEESMVPQLQQGEHGNTPDTVGGMTILQNSNNVVLGRKAKSFDDRVITRHVGRYIDWNMAYSKKREIKGDHHVIARGTSALLVRDIQNQALMQFGQFQGSPVIAPMVNWEAWIKSVLKAQHVDPTEILKSDAEIEALKNQPAQPDPAVALAQMKAQSEMQLVTTKAQAEAKLQQDKYQHEMQSEQYNLQLEQHKLQTGMITPHEATATARIQTAQINAAAKLESDKARSAAELAYVQTEQQISEQNAQARIQELQLKKELALLDYASKHQISLDQVKADLAKTSMIEGTKRQLAQAQIALNQSESHQDRMVDLHKHTSNQEADIHKHHTQLIADQSVIEPSGKAPPGEAFAK